MSSRPKLGSFYSSSVDSDSSSADSGYSDSSSSSDFWQDAILGDDVKKIVRKTEWPVRHEVRRELWRVLCYSKDFDSSKALYRTELEETARSGTKSHQPQFLSEEGVVVNNFDLNEQGAVRLLRLLTVIEHLRPEISSAPMLYPLCALMLHYLEDEDVFACVQHLLVTKGYLMTSPVQWSASSHTILSLVKKHKPHAYAMLKRQIGTADDAILVKALRDWLSWIFSGLPLSHVVRVVDCYLVEGHKFVTRAAIAIVYIWAKSLKNRPHEEMHGKSQEERIEAVKLELANTAAQMPISTETFIHTAIRIRNLQSSTISRLQAQFENKVREEVTRRHSQKRALPRRTRHLFTQPFSSAIVDQDAAAEIMSALPARVQLATPQLLFRLSVDGASFTHLWNKIDHAEQTLLLIKTTKGAKFGAYCSSSWAERNDRRERSKSKYFGTGESFVWVLEEELGLPIIYGWIGNNNEHPDTCPQMFMAAGDRLLVIGSGDGDSIRISEELTHGPMKGSVVEKYAHDALQFIFPKNCFEELIINFNVFHPTCPKMVLSRVLGIGITVGSMLLFVPQIIKIFNGKSAKGISLISQLLALVAAAGTASYSFNKGFVFSQWGDSFFVSVQLMIIVMQILYYSDASAYAFAFFAFCWAFVFAVIGGYIPSEILTIIQTLGIPITVASKHRMATATPTPSLLRRVGQGFVDFWRRMGNDYLTVAKETAEGCVEKPFKAGLYFTGLGTLVYAYRTNPSELRTMNELRELRQRMTLLPASIHNKETDAELAERSLLMCQNRLHYYNLWFFSLLVQSPHDSLVRIYESQDRNLKDWAVIEFFNNIYDVGVLGRWRRLEKKFKDYDVNHEELDRLPD
ncbi:Rab-GAP TBC domain-containing protein [Trichostrongylus colubriformis]|uniref:Mannose-P-dolichol utilization defect 1 protein homolog n=1 Tax=Trichostrongylus colubriformis TaxID=6319 RepID=A0AAN8FYE4_TRICO